MVAVLKCSSLSICWQDLLAPRGNFLLITARPMSPIGSVSVDEEGMPGRGAGSFAAQ